VKKFLKVVGIVLASIVGLFIFLMIVVPSGGSDATSKPATTAPTEKSPEKKTPAPQQAKIGDTLKVGDVEFKVYGKSESTNVGGEFGQKAKGKYLILNVSVVNRGKEAINIDSSFFKLEVDGKTYDSDAGAGVYANKDADFFYAQVNPDVELKGNVVFDVPADILNKDLTLDVQTGVFGTETGQISLK
jgi:hypothetical protein